MSRDDANWTILGEDSIGKIAVGPDEFRFYLTPCCEASVTGTADGVACRACYEVVDPLLGGTPPDPTAPPRPFHAGTKRVSDGQGCTERVPAWMDDPYGYDGNQ
ncbi:MAG TPA: hypothetical protein PLV93_10610 [Microthrixaceae bacterium]|nr:hypothetical protein [Microthrixaceae bacterium]